MRFSVDVDADVAQQKVKRQKTVTTTNKGKLG